MAVYGRLSAVDAKLAGIAYAVYTLPADQIQAYTTLDLNICNRSNEVADVYVYIETSTGDKIPVELSVPLGPKGVFLRTAIMVSPGDTLFVQSDVGSVSYVAYGMQDLYDSIAPLPLPTLLPEGATAPPTILQNAEFGNVTYANDTTYMVTGGGNVYVYNAADDVLLATLTVADPVGENFGASIAASNYYWVVSAPTATTGGNAVNAGVIYVYNSLSGALIARVDSPSDTVNASFGFSIDMNDTAIVVSEPGSGQAYLLDPDTQAVVTTYTAGAESTRYGNSVRIYNSFVAIGDPDQGIVETYSTASVEPGPVITSPIPNIDFGFDIDVRNGLIVVGAPALDYNAVTDGGGAYLYDQSGNFIAVLTSPETQTTNDFLGWSVAIGGQFVLVGSPFVDSGTTVDEGKVYAYSYAGDFVAVYAI